MHTEASEREENKSKKNFEEIIYLKFSKVKEYMKDLRLQVFREENSHLV